MAVGFKTRKISSMRDVMKALAKRIAEVSNGEAGAIAIAAVEDLAFVKDDGFAGAYGAAVPRGCPDELKGT